MAVSGHIDCRANCSFTSARCTCATTILINHRQKCSVYIWQCSLLPSGRRRRPVSAQTSQIYQQIAIVITASGSFGSAVSVHIPAFSKFSSPLRCRQKRSAHLAVRFIIQRTPPPSLNADLSNQPRDRNSYHNGGIRPVHLAARCQSTSPHSRNFHPPSTDKNQFLGTLRTRGAASLALPGKLVRPALRRSQLDREPSFSGDQMSNGTSTARPHARNNAVASRAPPFKRHSQDYAQT